MLIGVISDIHGNAHALEAVASAMDRLGVERVFCLGDVVGYYYEPKRCIDILSRWNAEYIKGNHESMLCELIDEPAVGPVIKAKYGRGLEVAIDELGSDELDFLRNLPEKKELHIGEKSYLLCHGAPWDSDQYIYPDADTTLLERCADQGADYVFLGHTHYQMSKQVGATWIVNPGSVGQPRDRQPGAAWVMLDSESGEVCKYRESYDRSEVQSQARQQDPNLPYLWEILDRQ